MSRNDRGTVARPRVFTTFFSFAPLFRPSTFFRAGWPSTKTALFLVSVPSDSFTPQLGRQAASTAPGRIFLENRRTGPGTPMRLWGRNGHTKRVALARWECVLQSPTSRACTSLVQQPASGWRDQLPFTGRAGLLAFTAVRFAGRALQGPAVSPAGLPRSSSCSGCSHGFYSHRAAVRRRTWFFSRFYFLTSYAERFACPFALFLRVFLPSVGKAQGGLRVGCP